MAPASLRSFSFGILVCTLIFSIYIYSNNDKISASPSEAEEVYTEEQLRQFAENASLRLLSEQEYQRLIDLEKAISSKEDNADNTTALRIFTLTIESGMTSMEIANELERHKIIDDANDFQAFLDANNVSHSIQIGTFELTSNMSYEEISAILTRKKL